MNVRYSLGLLFLYFLTFSCDPSDHGNGEIPTVSTTAVADITHNRVTAGGEVVSDGGLPVFASGFAYATVPGASTDGDTTMQATRLGRFVDSLTGLDPATDYYLRAYATNSLGTGYGEEVQFTTSDPPPLQIGDTIAGGIIFYLDASGEHGLVAAPTDLGETLWGCEGTLIGGTSTALGTGRANTERIVSQCPLPGIAARVCYDLKLNGYDDWYLPSRDELTLLHRNLYLRNIGRLKTVRYWSSSEHSRQFVWQRLFNLNDIELYYDKDLVTQYTRAIRTF